MLLPDRYSGGRRFLFGLATGFAAVGVAEQLNLRAIATSGVWQNLLKAIHSLLAFCGLP